MKIEDIMKLLDSKTDNMQIEEKTVFILDKDTYKLKRAWKRINGDFEEIDLNIIVGKIAHKLKDKIDPEALLRELLISQVHPESLLDIDERLEKEDATVKSKPEGCYSLTIGGKRGKPLELCIVHNQGYDT